MHIFRHIVSCYNVKDVHYSFSKNIHLNKMYNVSDRWRREDGTSAPMITKVV